MKTELLSATADNLKQVAELLTQNQVVALPTETVYGLAGNAFSPEAVQRIFTAKERPSFDPLIVHVSKKILSSSDGPLKTLVDQNILSSEVLTWSFKVKIEALLQLYWPGPLTVVLPKGSAIPDEVTSGQKTVGIRCPAHALFQEVLSQVSFPLAAPSANRFGRISPTQADHVMQELEDRVPAVLDGGACSVGVESTIIQISDPFELKILRPGKISASEIETALGIKSSIHPTLGQSNQAQLAPGMLEQHYAPRKPLFLVPHSFSETAKSIQVINTFPIKGKVAFLAMNSVPDEIRLLAQTNRETILSSTGSLFEMAQKLFSEMRALDEDSEIEILVADLPAQTKEGIGAAIADRLNRASVNKPFSARP